jgi:hypothetical protein
MPWTRRGFLRGAAAALACAPFARLLEGDARATGLGTAHRLVVFFTPNGTVHHLRRPVGSERSFSFPAGSILEPLAPVADQLILIDGLDFHGATNHEGGMRAMLTGNGDAGSPTGGLSLDQHVAAAVGQASKLPSLDLGVQTSAWGGGTQTRMSYGPGGVFVTPDDDPRHAFTRLFGDTSDDALAAERLLARRNAVLDLARADVELLHARLGAREQAKLEQHLASLDRLEATLNAPPPASCTAPARPTVAGNLQDHAKFGEIGRAQTDLLVAALACDLTRVASIQWAHTVAPQVLSFLGLADAHHALSHASDGDTQGLEGFRLAERWFAEQFRYLVEQLALTPDPLGGSLLDTTLVVWAKELGDSRMHVCEDVPFVLAGSAGGRFETGRYLRFQGEPHNRLLVSTCQAMGLSTTTFGDPAHGSGPLAGLA